MPLKIKYDKSIIISTGINRDSKKWKNKKLLWSDLVAKLSEAHRTHETVKEYNSYPKSRRDEIKDVGGFVGGNIAGGRRKKGAVTCRTLLTLDSDSSDLTLQQSWGLFKMLYGCAALIYTTHSHSPEDPRYRLVIPLDREVTTEEHEPIARKIAGSLDIEYFDNTTFQAERLMYWPSVSKDGEFISCYQDGPVLCADDILSEYIDWTDSSQWPVSAKAIEAVKRGAKKQGDPLEKPGLVGAFCRVYGIEEAIDKYLPDVYDKTDMEDRYTYVGGSTSAGLVVYDNKFSYSHHGTDPVSEKLCNSFDLVRIHLYGDLDADLEPGVPINKRPSYKQMKLACSQDKQVKKLIAAERIENARQDFGDLQPEENDLQETEEANNDWLTELEVDGDGNNKQTIDNLVLILENDTKIKDRIAIDVFKNNRVKIKKFYWTKDDTYLFKDADESHLHHYLEKCYGIFAPKKLSDALEIISEKNLFHPVRDYLNSLKWDRVPRLETLLIDLYGAEDNEYVRAVTRKTLAAAVSRVMKPGCKFDYMLLLIGDQGIKKSTFFSILAGKWFNGSFNFHMIGKKDSVEQLQGSWITEVQELDGMRRSDVDSVKSFVSNPIDEMRPAYGRYKMEYKRQGIFVGTSNEDTPLLDQTGGRRFWPVKVYKLPIDPEPELTVLRNQIWAEAVAIYKAGESLYLDDATEELAKKVQQDHTEVDVRADVIAGYLEKRIPDNWDVMDVWQKREYLQGEVVLATGKGVKRKEVTIMDIWIELFGGSVKDMTKNVARDINNIMRQMKDWEACRFGKNGERKRGYKKRVHPKFFYVDAPFN